MFRELKITNHAKTAQNEIIEHLETLGFECIAEYPVPDNGNDYPGRIDIVAMNGNNQLAIEVDRKTPRKKSLFKLSQMVGFQKVVLLRKRGEGYIVDDIEVLPIPLKRSD